MHIKKLFFLLTTFFAAYTASAQEAVSSQGQTYSNANGSVDFTLGEVITSTATNGLNDLTQGFQQTNWNFISVEDFAPDFQVAIFPNPTSDLLNIKTSRFENVTYTLYDAQGKVVMRNILSAVQTPIQVSQLAAGTYSLELIFKEGSKGSLSSSKLKVFKLVKTH